ncbi:uncharacterized protein LOC109727338 [Ananas comosus]|uniref:Uncharacterized protein LOC109727338 n=1 Tax=Ananas comosus TaxID=4615 RepID=A0A6P5H5N3_ANACO|nr:uncharacterized protein LOC109727338 [Ananas comosus]
MAPCEALYGRRCRFSIYWDGVRDRRVIEPNLVDDMETKIRIAREQLLTAPRRQSCYADQWQHDLEFQVGKHILLKISPSRGIKRFELRNKLSPWFVGLFEIRERVGSVAYRLALPPSLARVHNIFHMSILRKYIPDPSHVISPTTIQLQENLSYKVAPMRILAREVKQLWNRSFCM